MDGPLRLDIKFTSCMESDKTKEALDRFVFNSRVTGVKELIRFLGDDPEREGMRETPARFLKAMKEMLSGYDEDPSHHLEKVFALDDVTTANNYDQLIMSGEIEFVSFCEHHMLPFFGQIHIGYLPDGKGVVGLSKLARCADGYARRFQVQERLTQQIHDAVVHKLAPLGTIVVIQATHTCQCWRGVRKSGKMTTSALSGTLRTDVNARAEAFSLIKM